MCGKRGGAGGGEGRVGGRVGTLGFLVAINWEVGGAFLLNFDNCQKNSRGGQPVCFSTVGAVIIIVKL